MNYKENIFEIKKEDDNKKMLTTDKKVLVRDILSIFTTLLLIVTLSISIFKNIEKDKEIFELKSIIKSQQEIIINYEYDE